MGDEFLGSHLRLARLFHRQTLQEAAEAVGCSKQYLSRVEAGFERPSEVLQEKLAQSFEVLRQFFYTVDPMPISDEQCHFRKQLTTKAALRQEARAHGEMVKRLVTVLESRLDLPPNRFAGGDPSSAVEIERAAERSRADWGLGTGPIASMTRVAENAGAVVLRLAGMAQEIDAISFATRRPVVALNASGKSGCRSRFALAHEVGHFCLHVGVQTGDKLTEAQANRYASAFLMPRSTFAKECARMLRGTRLSWQAISAAKITWGVSKAAILYRGRQLGAFSEEQYVSGLIHLKRRGEALREFEDDAVPPEKPEIVEEGLSVLERSLGMPIAAVARAMGVKPSIVYRLTGKCPAPYSANTVSLNGA